MSSDTTGSIPEEVQAETLINAQARLLREGRSGDITIRCGEKMWKCHSDILAQRCEFFRAACEGEFKESVTKVINLDGDKEKAVEMLLVYLYTLKSPVSCSLGGFKGSFAETEWAYVTGDKYQLLTLKSAGQAFLKAAIKENVPFMYQMPETLFPHRWIDFTRRVWGNKYPHDDEIKAALLEAMIGNSKHLIEEPVFQKLLGDNSDFNIQFLRALSRKVSQE